MSGKTGYTDCSFPVQTVKQNNIKCISMKNQLIILLFIVSLIGCSDDNNEDSLLQDEISINTEAILFNSSAASPANSVTITSSGDWRLTGKKTWCEPSVISGKSGDQVTFTAETNDTGESRSIVYRFICGSKTAELLVTQSQNDVFELITNTMYDIEPAGADISVRLNTNVDLTIEIPDDSEWITDVYANYSTRSVEQNWLCFNVSENTTYKARTGKIILKGEGIEDQVITVNQAQNDAILLGAATYHVSPSGATVTVDVQTNVPYTVSIPALKQSWVTRTSVSGTPTVEGLNSFQETFEVGAGTVTRVAQVTFAGGAAATVAFFTQLSVNPVYMTVPDENFRSYLKDNDYVIVMDDAEGECIVTEDGINATSFVVNSRTIYSLAGIEAFTNLKTLNCSSNYITELDLSYNTAITSLTCTTNKLSKLILGDINITSLSFSSSNLRNPSSEYSTDLMIASNKLTTFTCTSTRLVTLDMSECPVLTSLTCSRASALTTLYLKESQVANLTTFSISGNTTVVYK